MSKDKNKITQFKCYFSFEKELNYIREMNKKGWKLVYIKGGILYTFVQTKPDEYTTIMYADEKEKISEVTAFAAQCGYENIPHTMDGVGTVLYLTGKKSEVSEEFVNETDAKINMFKHLRNKYRIISVLYTILLGVMLLETLFIITIDSLENNDIAIQGFSLFCIAFMAVIAIMTIRVFTLTRKYSKKIKALEQDSAIFE